MIVSKENFEIQMTYLKDNGYVTLTMAELYLFLTNEIDVPENSVVLTFDDGYKDNFIEAYPILKENDFNAVNFLITGTITKRVHPFNPKHVQYLSIKELNKACDVFEYQSHTYNYHRREHNLEKVEMAFLNSRTDEQVFHDIKTSIHNLNGENLAFAYPYGEYSPSTINILKDLEFKMAFTTVEQPVSPDDHLYELPRFNVHHSTTFEEFLEFLDR